MNQDSTLSEKGLLAANSPLRVDMEVYFEALQNRFVKDENPSGTFPMNVAENSLCWRLLKERIQKSAQKEIPAWVAGYGNPLGNDDFRESVARYLSTHLFKTQIDKETLGFSSGLTSVIDLTAFILAEPGTYALIPAPAYPVYTSDLGVKAGVKRYDIHTHDHLHEHKGVIPLEIEHLDNALDDLNSRGEKCSMLILTTPDNPTGGIYSIQELNEIATWCIQNQIHLVVSEIYGLSLINTQAEKIREDYEQSIQFESFGKIMKERKSQYLHLWYSFSKDLGISGFRVGMVHSYNEGFIQAYQNINMTHSVSNYTQWVLTEVLEDHAFIQKYLTEFKKALTDSYIEVIKVLKELRIPYSPSYGSLFVWMNLREYLKEASKEAEDLLWKDLYRKTGILLTPTDGFGHKQFGFFRMVISFQTLEELRIAMSRLKKYLKSN